MKDKNEIVYSINIDDIQSVAIQEIERELTDEEIEKIKDLIGEKISWFDATVDSINELLGNDDDGES